MREIKFRAWDKYDNEMWNDIKLQDMILTDGTLQVEYADFMQYTGLKDKNGVEIYEGDVTNNGIIKWDYIGFQWSCFSDGRYKNLLWSTSVFEVIGNIYENPELLKDNT